MAIVCLTIGVLNVCMPPLCECILLSVISHEKQKLQTGFTVQQCVCTLAGYSVISAVVLFGSPVI